MAKKTNGHDPEYLDELNDLKTRSDRTQSRAARLTEGQEEANDDLRLIIEAYRRADQALRDKRV